MSKNKIVLFGAILSGSFLVWMVWYQFNASHTVREFHDLLSDSKQQTFNLGQLSSVDWDEMTIWGQGKNNCELGIDGLQMGNSDCRSITNEREIYVVLLKTNKVVAMVPVNRRMIDLLKSDLPARVAKKDAIFSFKTQGDFPLVELKPNI